MREVSLHAITGLPTIVAGDDLGALVGNALATSGLGVLHGDVVVVTSKVLSRAEGQFVRLNDVVPSSEACEWAIRVGKDPRVVELILRESTHVSRYAPGVMVTRHRLGFVSANAAIDASNARPNDNVDGDWVLLMPKNPDATARALRDAWVRRFGVDLAVLITDTWGRPFRVGTVGFCVGLSGLSAVDDRRGEHDRFGRVLQATAPCTADAIAAAADLVAGQGDESTPVVLVRGWKRTSTAKAETEAASSAAALVRGPKDDLYA